MAVQTRHIHDFGVPVSGVLRALERRAYGAVGAASVPVLRMTVGVVFVWFGALKVAGTTPVGDLVAATVPFLNRVWFVPALGLVEILLGVAVATGVGLRIAVPVLVAHLVGTFSVLVVLPQLAFQHDNPMLLTTIGEFVVKNVVLIAAAVVIGAHHHRATRR